MAAGLFVVLLLVAFRRPAGEAIAFGAFMLAFYIPIGYLFDSLLWRRRLRASVRSKSS